jgi:hypothetical protein
MKLAVIAVCAGAAAGSLQEGNYEFLFSRWTKEHGKAYETQDFFQRYHNFRDNLDFVIAENAKNLTYTLAMNEFGDLTWDEFKAQRMGYQRDSRPRQEFPFLSEIVGDNIAASVDWRTSNVVTPVKDQGSCGSCWAFSATGSFEGAYAQAHKTLLSFSEQQLVDCSGPQGNNGCGGGLMDRAFVYWEKTGACLEGDYIYTARNGVCHACTGRANVAKYVDIPKGEANLLNAANIGPISVAIEADQSGFQFYSSGVFKGTCGQNLDHGVLVVGYGDDSTGTPYWIVKNSWGARWGESGYIRIQRNLNLCGISNEASYPVAV